MDAVPTPREAALLNELQAALSALVIRPGGEANDDAIQIVRNAMYAHCPRAMARREAQTMRRPIR